MAREQGGGGRPWASRALGEQGPLLGGDMGVVAGPVVACLAQGLGPVLVAQTALPSALGWPRGPVSLARGPGCCVPGGPLRLLPGANALTSVFTARV